MIRFITILLAAIFVVDAWSATINGLILEKGTNEPLVGAMVVLKGTNFKAISGLDGSFLFKNVPNGSYTLSISYVSYAPQNISITVTGAPLEKIVFLESNISTISGVKIVASRNLETVASARDEEKKADNAINVISSKSIELSPDITVANVVQRVSGLTVERNSNGDGQYAIVRGMDKRYNYTLVNGIKIPSPDNENRYVPLDIIPSDLLSRLVVSKSLTPDMEGDAIGGVVDMKLKEAPSERVFKVGLATGYNEMFVKSNYDYFNPNDVNRTSPRKQLGKIIKAEDLDYGNFNLTQIKPMPNTFASLVWGNRFLKKKLGVIIAGSYQNSYRASDRVEFGVSDNNRGQLLPRISQRQDRDYSIQQNRTGLFNKLDYQLNEKHHFFLTSAYMRLQNNESRSVWIDELRGFDNPTLEYNIRNQVNIQQIINTTLQGEHSILKSLKADWSLVYSMAKQEIPDNSMLRLVSNYDLDEPRWLLAENFTRIWEGNSDQDASVYYNFVYTESLFGQKFEFKYGGLQRIKNRTNSYDLYSFKPNPGIQEFELYETNLQDITWRTTGGSGTATHVLNYESYENIFANYLQLKFTRWNTQFLGGVRAEHTNQGYTSQNPTFPGGSQEYWSILPSIHLKYMPNDRTNWRTSYFKSISRPSFLEIIPYRRPFSEELFAQAGNPEVKNAEAHNLDFRYEFFPKPTEQLLVGAFYKLINDPIEYAVIPGNTPPNNQIRSALMPVNFENATNLGLELDYSKYFNRFGIKANYTFTFSRIESLKRTWGEVTEENINQISELQQSVDNIGIGDSTFISVTQIRPLQGQSMHLGNLSLLYKNQDIGLDAQLALVYTGERIAFVTVGLDNDIWQKAFTQLDFSLDKIFGSKKQYTIYCKINNILNSPFEMYIKKGHSPDDQITDKMQPNGRQETLVRYDLYNRNYMIGFKYNLK